MTKINYLFKFIMAIMCKDPVSIDYIAQGFPARSKGLPDLFPPSLRATHRPSEHLSQ